MVPGTTLADLDHIYPELSVFGRHLGEFRSLLNPARIRPEFVPVHVGDVGQLGPAADGAGRPRSPHHETWPPGAGKGGRRRRRRPWCARPARRRALPAGQARNPRPIADSHPRQRTTEAGTGRELPGIRPVRGNGRYAGVAALPPPHILAMYRFDTSLWHNEVIHRAGAGHLVPHGRTGGAGRHGRATVTRAGARGARAAARDADARIRAAQAAQLDARRVPGLRLRVAVPVPEAAPGPGADRGGGPGGPGRSRCPAGGRRSSTG